MSADNDIAPDPEGDGEAETAASGAAEVRPGVTSQVVDVGAGNVDVPEAGEAEPPPSSAAETGNAVRALVARLKPGTLIDDKYCIQSAIGRGGMGVVMSARHQHLNRDVALKFLCMPGGAQEDLRTRFRREAQVNAKLKNEHITRVLDVGKWEGIAFMVMERLEGADLRRRMREEGGSLPVHVALNYTLQLCEGIAEAHAHGIVHRDLKPSNLFITQNPDGSALLKIMDFGISKWKDDEVGEITKDGTILGSPKYMAPEQIFGAGQIDARADVWSIAAICYEMIGGRTPYKEPTLARFCAEIMSGPPPALSSVARQPVPPALSDVLARCFERDVALRPQSVAELAGALLDAVDSPGASLREKLQAIIAMRPRNDSDASGSLSGISSLAGVVPASGVSHVSRVIMPPAQPTGMPKAFLIAGASLALLGVVLLGATVLRSTASHAEASTPPRAQLTATATATSTATPTATDALAAPPTLTPMDMPKASAAAVQNTAGAATSLVKPLTPPFAVASAPHPGGTASAAAAGTPPTKSTKADDDIPTMR